MRTALVDLDAQLRERGSRLLVRRGDAARELNRVAEEAGSWGVYLNRDHTPYARQRDTRATRGLQMTGVVTQTFDDLLLVSPHATLDAEGRPAIDFDAFSSRWLERLDLGPEQLPDAEGLVMPEAEVPESIPNWAEALAPGLDAPSAWPGATSASANSRLAHFVAGGLAGYRGRRAAAADVDATSRLSAALKFGTISVRDVARAVLGRAAADDSARDGAELFMLELCRREHAHHLVHAFPDITSAPIRGTARSDDGADQAALASWMSGGTGVALVDAAMRQLLADGWIPDVLRQLVAANLAQAGVDPRAGERHFARHLVDFDVAINHVAWRDVAEGPVSNPLP